MSFSSKRLTRPNSRLDLYRNAVHLRSVGRFKEALVALDQLEQLYPRYSRLFEERGHCYVALKSATLAIEAFRHAVDFNAALRGSWQMLHTLYLQTGDDEGVTRTASQLTALGQLPAQIIEAGSLFADGELVPAEHRLRLYLAQHGEHPEALRMLGRVYLALGMRDDAELLLEAVVERCPGYRAARSDYVRALLEQRRFDRCRQQLQLLLGLAPDNRTYLRWHAEVCVQLGEFEPGMDQLRQLLHDAQPGRECAELNLWIGYSQRVQGRPSEAVQNYRAALAALPQLGEAWWGLANLKTYRFDSDEISRMRATEAAPETSAPDRCHLCFSLGKALEDHGSYEESWEFYKRGNARKHAEVGYLPRAAEAHVQRSQLVFTREFFEARRDWGHADPDPIFILGLPRSGSTLIEQILASHSQVEGTQELAEIQRIARSLRARHPHLGNQEYPTILADFRPQEIRKLGEQFLADTQVYRKTKRPFFIDKLPDNFRDIGFIHLMLPNAKIIDVRREPMACCFSNFKQLFTGGQEFSYSLKGMAHYFRCYLAIMRHWHAVLPGRILTVQYEDVVNTLETSVRRILDHCGLPFEAACLKSHSTLRSIHTASSEQVRQPIHRDGISQWKNYAPWLGALKDELGEALGNFRD